MIPVIIIGYGGHAKVIVDILQSGGKFNPIGFTDPQKKGEIGKLPVIGDDDILGELFNSGVIHAFIALGDNQKRLKIGRNVEAIGYNLINAISPHAILSDTIKMGIGIAIMPGVVVNPEVTIADYAILNTGATVDHDCVIGKASHIAPGCHLAGCVTIDEGVFLGIGTNVVPEIHIGEWTIIGAGSTIIKNIPPHSKALGSPAKVIQCD